MDRFLSLPFFNNEDKREGKMYEKKFSRSGYIFFLLLFFPFFSVVFRGHPRFLKNEAAVFEARRRLGWFLKNFFHVFFPFPRKELSPPKISFRASLSLYKSFSSRKYFPLPFMESINSMGEYYLSLYKEEIRFDRDLIN